MELVQLVSIAVALLMPTAQPATGEGKPPASEGEDTFATVLDAALSGETNAAAPAVVAPSFPTTPPALQLQTTGLPDEQIAAMADGIPGALASSASDEITTGQAALATPETALNGASMAPDAVEQAAANPNADTPAAPIDAAMSGLQSAQASSAQIVQASTVAPAVAATKSASESKPATSTNGAGDDGTDNSANAGQAGTTSPAPTGQPTPAATPIVASAPTAVPFSGESPTEAAPAFPQQAAAAQEPALIPDDSASSEAAPSTAAEAPANTNRAASPASSQTTAQAATAAVGEAAAPKVDFAAMVASQATAAPEATSQTSPAPADTPRAITIPQALQSAPAATIQVYNRIVERADGRAQRFEIRLDPAELGRVDVRIEIGADKKVHAVLAAHDSAALSDLMRGQRALERALTDAGLDLADKGVRFELASDNGSTANQQRNGEGGRASQPSVWRSFHTMTLPATAETAAAVQPSWRPQRLDLVA